jgi:hypothetical protein
MDVYVAGKKMRIDPARALGKGGEADVYDIGNSTALKLFKAPGHPDFLGQPDQQQAAGERIATHQKKLREFPVDLPLRVVSPLALATDKSGKQVLGYTMPLLAGAELLLRFSERGFRQNVSTDDTLAVFKDLHPTLLGLHQKGVVIGDFNDSNVLVSGQNAFLIDADSFQFGAYCCRMFTTRFVDPLLCDPRAAIPDMIRPHNADSDWYAFAVMLMQSLLFVGPYGGVHRPADAAKRVPHEARPLRRVTVFDPEVRYPKPALHYSLLPDDLLQQFHAVFQKDQRGVFPVALLNSLRWTRCGGCGAEHARAQCPQCATAAPAAVKQLVRVRGEVTSTRVFQTDGVIVRAALHNGELVWLSHEGGVYKRENGEAVLRAPLHPGLRFWLQGDATFAGAGGGVEKIQRGVSREKICVDTWQGAPVFDCNSSRRYRVYNGQLLRDGVLGEEFIGDVLGGQTRFWAGENFGFGFYRAGTISVAFVFDALRRGIKDTLKLPELRGHLLDCDCVFAADRCWFFAAVKDAARTVHHAALIRADGGIEARAQGEAGDGTWLAALRGKCAAGNFLLAATDEGLVRLEPSGGSILKTRVFSDTEPFVDGGSQLFAGRRGVYIVEPRRIQVLTMA